MMLRNKKRLSQSGELTPAPRPMKTTTTEINSLSNEVLIKIFSCLGHGDKLWTRLVCQRWNEIVSTDNAFLKMSEVCIDVSSGFDHIGLLKNSKVDWRHLSFSNMSANGRALMFKIPLRLKKKIISVKIINTSAKWKVFQQFLAQFPALKELRLHRSTLHVREIKNVICKSNLQNEFEAVLNNLTTFCISQCEDSTLVFVLKEFPQHMKLLSFLKINEGFCRSNTTRANSTAFHQGIYEFIKVTCKTLKILKITIWNLETFVNIFKNVIRKLNESKMVQDSLDLDAISIKHVMYYWNDYNFPVADCQAMLEFLKINKNIRKVDCLFGAMNFPTRELSQQIINTLPRDITFICLPDISYFPLIGSLYDRFKQLEVIHVRSNIRVADLAVQQVRNLKRLERLMIINIQEMKSLAFTFPNLTSLSLDIKRVSPNTSKRIIHRICRNLNLLVVLDLLFSEGGKVTDCGVTGISPSYCRHLEQFKGKQLEDKLKDIPPEHIIGRPLCSLRRLRYLTMRGATIDITDIGYCYGFQFQSLTRLRLYNSGTQSYITSLGLKYIAKHNRGLEHIVLDKIVSDIVYNFNADDFRKRLDRCKPYTIEINALQENVGSSSSDDDDDWDWQEEYSSDDYLSSSENDEIDSSSNHSSESESDVDTSDSEINPGD